MSCLSDSDNSVDQVSTIGPASAAVESKFHSEETTKSIWDKGKKNLTIALDRVERYGLTPLPSIENGFLGLMRASPYNIIQGWINSEFFLRLDVDNMGKPRNNFDEKKKKQSDRVISNLETYYSCAVKIIIWALRKRANQIKEERGPYWWLIRKQNARIIEEFLRDYEMGGFDYTNEEIESEIRNSSEIDDALNGKLPIDCEWFERAIEWYDRKYKNNSELKLHDWWWNWKENIYDCSWQAFKYNWHSAFLEEIEKEDHELEDYGVGGCDCSICCEQMEQDWVEMEARRDEQMQEDIDRMRELME